MDISKFLEEVPENFEGIVITIKGNEFYIHSQLFYSMVIVLILSVFCIYCSAKVKRANPHEKSTGVVFFAEFLVKMFDDFTLNNLGKSKIAMAPYLATLTMFLLFANLSGLLGFSPPTSDYNVTFALALITIVLVHYYAVKENGVKNYFKGYFEPFAFMLPMNILDIVVTPVSMSLRLFGNILAGGILLTLTYQATGYFAPLVTPAFHFYFDVFAGGIQTLVFVLLTTLFVNG